MPGKFTRSEALVSVLRMVAVPSMTESELIWEPQELRTDRAVPSSLSS